MKKAAKQIIFYSALIGIWALVAKLHVWPPYLFPPPWGVAEALWAGFADHSFWIGVVVTMKRMLIGYSLSVVLGMILGLGVASNKFLEETVGGLLVSLQSLPSICWIPLAVLWFGLTEKAILFVVLMGSLLSVTIAMEDGRNRCRRSTAWRDATSGPVGSAVLVGAVAGQPALYRFRTETGLGVWVALADSGRDDFPQPGTGTIADDGPRPQRHEPGDCRDDPDHPPRLRHRWPRIPHLGAEAAGAVGTGGGVRSGHGSQASGPRIRIAQKIAGELDRS